MNEKVTEYINNAPKEQAEIMKAVRKLIHESVNGVLENYKWSRPVFSLEKDFAYLKTAKNHITIGFFNFEKIDDKQNRLEGTGKSMRHIKLKNAEDIKPEHLKKWFKAVADG